MPETLIWGYIIQLSGVLRQIHAAGLACRVLDPTKILVTGERGVCAERGGEGGRAEFVEAKGVNENWPRVHLRQTAVFGRRRFEIMSGKSWSSYVEGVVVWIDMCMRFAEVTLDVSFGVNTPE